MTEVFEKNLDAVRAFDPELAERLEKLPPTSRVKRNADSRTGRVTISVQGPSGSGSIRFPELKTPELDSAADELAAAKMVVILGFGSGALLSEVVGRTSGQTFVLLIEPDIDAFAAVLREADMSRVLGVERVSLSVGERPEAATFVRAEREYNVFTLTDFTVIQNPWSAPMYEEYFSAIKKKLDDLRKFGSQNMITMSHMGERWRDNILQNLPAMLGAMKVSDLFGRFENTPAIVVAAGPSLDKNAHQLASVKGKALIIAVDTAVRRLLVEGLEPDIVVSLDAKDENYLHLAGVSLPGSLMVFNPVAHPRIVSESASPMAFTGYPEPFFEWIETVIGARGDVRAGGSVATSAFDLALKLGCAPIIFVGQDLAYSKNRTHARETLASILSPGQDGFNDMSVITSFETTDLFGLPVATTAKMESWRKWFEIIIDHESVFALNATEGGVPIRGAENITLAEAAARYASRDMDAAPPAAMRGDKERSVETGPLIEALVASRDEARTVKTLCARGMASLKKAAGRLMQNGTVERGSGGEIDLMRKFSQDILERELFTEINRWRMEKTLNSVEKTHRLSEELDGKERSTMMMEAYRILFSEIYDTASSFERAVNGAIRELKALEVRRAV